MSACLLSNTAALMVYLEAQGVGAPNAPGHTPQTLPSEAPVVDASGKPASIGITGGVDKCVASVCSSA